MTIQGDEAPAEDQGECEPLRVAFEGELPSQIADARSLVLDFEFARNCALLYQNLDNVSIDEPSQEVPQQALWSAAAISYRRGFSTGKALLQPQAKRLKVPDNWLNLLSPEQREAHAEILEVASRQVAHQTGHAEHVRVIALLSPPPMPRDVMGLLKFTVKRTGPTADRIQKVVELCDVLLLILSEQEQKLGEQLIGAIKAKGLDEVYASPHFE
ncbi:hypothetical protein [[Mycobacterium] burgundiense]|uniref:Uncharacterized protein n=1 Tax=[Mycobacterium] burgundiense TaxID=3064286 RepID=A0ABM9LLE4_9MYCO|nr:hypothetical protein [Mycolicibacterium sp. MU0053]CAJ1501017.1 hypothetical protein MU0053_001819 [Mycolicibacterium sp. MU0053]